MAIYHDGESYFKFRRRPGAKTSRDRRLDSDRAKAAELNAKDISVNEIAIQLGYSLKTVEKWTGKKAIKYGT